ARLRAEIEDAGPFGEATLVAVLQARFGVRMERGSHLPAGRPGPGQQHYDAAANTLWFPNTAPPTTRQFQLARLYRRLAAGDVLTEELHAPVLSSPAARQLADRAFSSYLAGAIVLPYAAFLEAAETCRYDLEVLQQQFGASFEQVAQRLVSLRRPGAAGVP